MIIKMLIKERKNPLSTKWKLNGSSFEQTWIPYTLGCIVPAILVEIVQVVLEKKIKMWKVYDNNDGQRTKFDQKSSRVFGSGELKTKQQQ